MSTVYDMLDDLAVEDVMRALDNGVVQVEDDGFGRAAFVLHLSPSSWCDLFETDMTLSEGLAMDSRDKAELLLDLIESLANTNPGDASNWVILLKESDKVFAAPGMLVLERPMEIPRDDYDYIDCAMEPYEDDPVGELEEPLVYVTDFGNGVEIRLEASANEHALLGEPVVKLDIRMFVNGEHVQDLDFSGELCDEWELPFGSVRYVARITLV